MNVQIRPLMTDDITSVAAIERQAFPTLWPPTPFKGELNNRHAKYLVAWEPKWAGAPRVKRPVSEEMVPPPSDSTLFGRVVGAVRGRFSSSKAAIEANYDALGFVGMWLMAGEAHITAIAVEEASRGKGIGELLLMGSVELAMGWEATVVTLEARVSNHVAQSLYEKYGFQTVGIRKGYYTDDREDAVIMTTQPITTVAYRKKLHTLKEAYKRRYGEINIVLA